MAGGLANGSRPRWCRPRRVLMFPLPFQGHINPMLQLGDALHARGLAVTVLHTHFNAPDPARHPEFQFVPVPDGVPAHVAARGNVIDIIEAMNAAMEADGSRTVRAVLESVVADEEQPPAACIVFDANLLAVPRAASAVGLKTLVLRTASAACLGCFMAYPMLHQRGYHEYKLRLNKFVHIMKASNIRGSITNNLVCFASIKMPNNHALVMSPCTCITPSTGAIGCKSIATMRGRSRSLQSGDFCWYIQVLAQNLQGTIGNQAISQKKPLVSEK